MTFSRDKARGAFIGLAVGDALGTTIEFKDRDTYPHITDMIGGGPFNLKPGEWTDDTSMAICLSDSLIEKDGVLDKEHLLGLFINWWRNGYNSVNGRCFDIGSTTRTALDKFLQYKEMGGFNAWSVGNGGIMRLSPAVIAGGQNWPLARDIAIDQSYTTHAHPDCLEAAEILAGILWANINESDRPKPAGRLGDFKINSPRLVQVYNSEISHFPRDLIKSSGYAIDTLEAAAWAVDTSNSFEEAVLKAVNLGDDADTVGAVAGQIAGSKWGFSSIPEKWLEVLAWNCFLLETVDDLYEIGLSK